MNIQSNKSFRVVTNSRYQIPSLVNETTTNYEFSFNQIEKEHYKISLEKLTYRLNAHSVKLGLPAKIIQEYSKALFPIFFEIRENFISITNTDEIIQKLKTKREKLKVTPEYFSEIDVETNRDQYDLINTICDQFVTESKNARQMVKYFLPLDFLKMAMFFTEKSDYEGDYQFPWVINLFDYSVVWSGKKNADPFSTSSVYEGAIKDDTKFIEKVVKFGTSSEDYLKRNKKELSIVSNITHKVEFLDQNNDFDFSETKIKIDVGNLYQYQETTYISAINNKEPKNE